MKYKDMLYYIPDIRGYQNILKDQDLLQRTIFFSSSVSGLCVSHWSGESGQSAGSVQSGPHLLTKTFRPKIEEKNQQTFAGTTFIAVVFSVSFSRNVAMSMGRPFSGSLQNKVYSAHRWGRR